MRNAGASVGRSSPVRPAERTALNLGDVLGIPAGDDDRFLSVSAQAQGVAVLEAATSPT
jgi:hypothetical protein